MDTRRMTGAEVYRAARRANDADTQESAAFKILDDQKNHHAVLINHAAMFLVCERNKQLFAAPNSVLNFGWAAIHRGAGRRSVAELHGKKSFVFLKTSWSADMACSVLADAAEIIAPPAARAKWPRHNQALFTRALAYVRSDQTARIEREVLRLAFHTMGPMDAAAYYTLRALEDAIFENTPNIRNSITGLHPRTLDSIIARRLFA